MLKTDLSRWGIKSLDGFKRLIDQELERRYPGRSVDDLLTHPSEAILYCRYVNELYYTPIDDAIPDDVILRALIAYRKSGQRKKNLLPPIDDPR